MAKRATKEQIEMHEANKARKKLLTDTNRQTYLLKMADSYLDNFLKLNTDANQISDINRARALIANSLNAEMKQRYPTDYQKIKAYIEREYPGYQVASMRLVDEFQGIYKVQDIILNGIDKGPGMLVPKIIANSNIPFSGYLIKV